jgi:(1->4)-alpha-D-glucan 1-alpha-D-glucosylmutase
VALPVYRTYVDERIPVPAGTDRRLLVGALADAGAFGRAGPAALEALADVLLGAAELGTPEHERLRLRFVERFQQLSGPAAAKGIEDTAFYAYAPLLSRNEVGGAPDTPLADAVGMFHEGNRHRAECWPAAMLAASTHDTKRSADARARLDVLTEVAPEWAACVARWHRWNRPHRRAVRGRSVPDAGTVFHVLQAIVALWPVESARPGAPPPDADCLASLRERVGAYALKAAREAERRTSWVAPDEEFEAALADYVEAALCPRRSPRFLADVGAFARRVGRAGLWNSLARTVLQLASPGVPDIYQGDELWNLALVDPDNRRPVDFDQRVRLLDEVAGRFDEGGVERDRLLAEMVHEPEDGRIKLHVTRAALAARRRHPRLFVGGSYLPLFAAGAGVPAGPGQLVAFGRAADGAYAVAVAPRLVAAAAAGGTTDEFWAGVELPLPEDWPREWRCALSGAAAAAPHGALRAADVLARLPVALLVAPPA